VRARLRCGDRVEIIPIVRPPDVARRVDAAADRVVKLYQTWGRPEKAAEWREKLMARAPIPSKSATPSNPAGH
jgi:hypothetical protein